MCPALCQLQSGSSASVCMLLLCCNSSRLCYMHLQCCSSWLQHAAQRLCSWQGLIGPATHLCTADCTRDDELRVHSCFEHFAAVSAQHPQNGQRRAHTSASTVREWSIRVAQQADCRMSSTLFVPHLVTICWVLLNKCSTTMQHASCLDAFCFPSEAAHWQPRPLRHLAHLYCHTTKASPLKHSCCLQVSADKVPAVIAAELEGQSSLCAPRLATLFAALRWSAKVQLSHGDLLRPSM